MFSLSPTWKRALRIFTWIRWGCMLVLALGAFQLVQWNRNYDPRFYHFLGTTPGRILARVMKWPTLYNLPRRDKPLSEYSSDELKIKRRLTGRLYDTWPTHVVTINTGETFKGRIVHEEGRDLWLKESFGRHGDAEIRLSRDDIVRIAPFTDPMPQVTWRDVRFQMEYPDFEMFFHQHYTVLTDAPFFQVAESVHELERLYSQFAERMGDLVQHEQRAQGIQVLFFTHEEDYRHHQTSDAPMLSDSSGFYSPLQDRMVVFNQFNSSRSTQVRDDVKAQIDDMLSRARTSHERKRIHELEDTVETRIRNQANRETFATLRHEGTHQLLYTLGVHSWFHAENAWIIEGMAVYFEPPTPGKVPLSYLSSLIQLSREGRLLSLEELMSVREPEQLQRYAPRVEVFEAYALAWSLIHFCMQPGNQDGFFNYLRYIRDPANLDTLVDADRSELLADHLGLSPAELESAWFQHLRNL